MKKHYLFSSVAIAACLLFAACSVNVKKNNDGSDKNVQINTPVGQLHVSNDAKAIDTGLPVYPGAQLASDDTDANKNNANVNIATGFFGLKVAAIAYDTNDSADSVKDYYLGQLKKYGAVLTCHSSGVNASTNFDHGDSDSEKLVCEQDSGKNYELKSGVRDNQHIVSIEPRDHGCKFTLVYVRIRGKESTI